MFCAKEEKFDGESTWTCKFVLRDKYKFDKDKVFFWNEKCEMKLEVEYRVVVVVLVKIVNMLFL